MVQLNHNSDDAAVAIVAHRVRRPACTCAGLNPVGREAQVFLTRRRRRLSQADTGARVSVQINAGSFEQVPAISSDVGTVVSDGTVQVGSPI